MGDIISFLSGLSLFVIACLVMIAYWPQKGEMRTAAGLLGIAIFLSFFADAANTFYWQGFNKFSWVFGLSRTDAREFGQYLDLIFKGGAAVAGVLHLVALKLQIEDETERKDWHWWEMPWYPERKACVRAIRAFLRKRDE